MPFSFKILQSTTGSALLLTYREKKYLFGCFEGFLRYSIINQISIADIDCFIPLNKYHMIPLVSIYLTFIESDKYMNILCGEKYKKLFMRKRPVQILNYYADKYLCIKKTRHSIRIKFNEIPEKFDRSKLPVNFPNKYIKLLFQRENVFFENKEYIWSDYVKYVQLDDVLISNKKYRKSLLYFTFKRKIKKESKNVILLKKLKYHKKIQILNFSLEEKRMRKKKLLKKNTILFLGTGAAIPSKNRNVSGIFINMENRLIMFDCGEDSYGQLMRYFRKKIFFEKTIHIFISHEHEDHFLGLFKFIKMGFNIVLYGNPIIEEYLKIFKLEDKIQYYTIEEQFEIKNGNINFTACRVTHSKYSVGFAITIGNKKISYSGDCRPSNDFAVIANHSDILIHEATFSSEDEGLAVSRRHSTFLEAENIFLLSKSKKLILSHFSNRLTKNISYKKFTCARDFLSISF